jgi:hypothetical protein
MSKGEKEKGAKEEKQGRDSEVPKSRPPGLSQNMDFPEEMRAGAISTVDEYDNPMMEGDKVLMMEEGDKVLEALSATMEAEEGATEAAPFGGKPKRGLSQNIEFPEEMGLGSKGDDEVEKYANPLHEEYANPLHEEAADEGNFLAQIRASPSAGAHEFTEWGKEEDDDEDDEDDENDGNIWYQWYCNGDMLVGYNDRTLEIPDCQPWHAGVYVCCAHNGTGQAQSTPAMLEVLQMPVVQPRPMLSTALVELSVDVDAKPPPKFQWYCDGVAMAGETRPTITVDPQTSGIYKCVATNDMGSVQLSSVRFPLREVPVEEPEGGWPEEDDDWWAEIDSYGEDADARGADPRGLGEIIAAKQKDINDYRTRGIRDEVGQRHHTPSGFPLRVAVAHGIAHLITHSNTDIVSHHS